MPASAPPRAFRRAAVRKAKVERPVTSFTIERLNDEGEVVGGDEFHATMPTEERLFMIAAMVGDDENSAASATALLDILRESLPPKEYLVFRTRFLDPEDEDLSLEVVEEIVEHLMEQWSGFPTGPSQGSSGSQTTSGPKSTGRVRGQGSTH